jgi:two-component system CheB/CheR fusion protein
MATPELADEIAACESMSGTISRRYSWPDSQFGWIAAGLASCIWVYAAYLGVLFIRHVGPTNELDWIADWGAIPAQSTALLLVTGLLFRLRSSHWRERAAWFWVFAFTATSIIATYLWNTKRVLNGREVLRGPDFAYLADYWMLTAAFAVWFVRAGGSFGVRRVWLDGLTMIAVLLVGLWSFFLGPSVAKGTGAGISFAATFGYSITIVCMMSMAALLCLQTPSLRGRIAVWLVVAAGLLDVAWEIMWMASWLSDRDFVGSFYNYGDVLCFATVCSAVAATRSRRLGPPATADLERRMDSFLPALAVLVAIALVAGSVASTRRTDAWILVALVMLCALLLITRQHSARREVRALNREIARREADARLTELVRRSTDLILVADSGGLITYASPATVSLLGVSPEALQNTRAVELFGHGHAAALRDLFERSASRPATIANAELRVRHQEQKLHCYQLSAANQIRNDVIQGIVLTVTDITDQRMLEREVLDAVSRERIRLAGEIHDGLGQELVGIAMLLHGAAKARDPDAYVLRGHVQAAVGHINRVVGSARDLARGLWPLGVMRGSLASALARLVPDFGASLAVHLAVDPRFEECIIDDFCADHLYRIAQEAVSNALRHSGGTRIDITLWRTEEGLLLEISDNGRGFDTVAAENPGLGSRLMGYRARLMGATLKIDHARNDGTCVTVCLPIAAYKYKSQDATTSELSGPDY